MMPSQSTKPFRVDVVLQQDTECRLVMDYEPIPYDCLRLHTLAYGQTATRLWGLVRDVAPSMLGLASEEEFLTKLADERTVAAQSPQAMLYTELQPLLGRYLSIMIDADQHASAIQPGTNLRLFWSGPGNHGVVCEDTVASTARYPLLPR
jgi:hypothetical protein